MSVPGHASPFSDRARKRDLWWQFTVRAVETRHRGSYLGWIWAILNPLLMLAIYAVVFGKIFGGHFGRLPNETPADFVLAMFLGLIIYHLLAETIAIAPTLVVSQPNLVKKVVFPLDVLPTAQVGAFCFHFFISLGLMLAGAVFFGRGVSLAGICWLPVILAPLVLMSVGLAWIFAALGVFFRDLTQAMPFVALILLYASAIFYPLSKISPEIWMFLKWNPLLHLVELARDALLWNVPINLKHLAYTYACGLLLLAAGKWIFMKLQPAFADVI
jgi:lipopolysaccharide transport system permease protein